MKLSSCYETWKEKIQRWILCYYVKLTLLIKTARLVNIPGYNLIHNERISSKGGGTAILVRSNISYKLRKDLVVFEEKEFESTIIELTLKNGKPTIVGSFIDHQILLKPFSLHD